MTAKLVRVWSLLLIVAVGWLIVSAGYERFAGPSTKARYLVLSDRPESLDSSIKNASLLGAHVTYARQHSEFGASMLTDLNLVQPPDLVLVIDHGGSTVATETDPAKISALLDSAVPTSKPALPSFALASLVGVWLGAICSRLVYRHASWILAVGAGSAWWKWTHQCPTCPALTIAGIDAAFLGFLLLSLMALAAVFRQMKEAHAVLVAGACLITTWQIVAVLTAASVDCFPCALVASVNFSLVGSTLFGSQTYSVEVARPRLAAAALVSSLAGFAVLTVVALPSSPEAAEVVRGATQKGPTVRNWQGANLKDLGVVLHEKLKEPVLVCVGRSTCPPCVEAKTYLEAQAKIPCRYLELPQPGQTTRGVFADITFEPETFYHTPTFLIVSRSGDILSFESGWTNDQQWIQAFLYSVSRTLHLAARSNS